MARWFVQGMAEEQARATGARDLLAAAAGDAMGVGAVVLPEAGLAWLNAKVGAGRRKRS